jgi:D-alanyl-D-alanine carboxypeptidase
MRSDAGTVRAALSAALLLLVMMTASSSASGPSLLFEPATGLVLHAEQPDRSWHPASVTKLMTAYLVFAEVKAGRLAWDADVPLSEWARVQPATRIGLRGGIRINVEQAVLGMILRSANDFSTALAEKVGGTEGTFVQRMNETARRLGMTRTRFKNPHGLPDEEQVTTARDLAVLTSALLRDFPERAEIFATPSVRIHKGTFHSANDLLRTLEGADGMKTGFTCASGYNVVASATRGGRRLVAIVLGAPNRNQRSAEASDLIEAGFAKLATMPPAVVASTAPGGVAVLAGAARGAAAASGEPASATPARDVASVGKGEPDEDEGPVSRRPATTQLTMQPVALASLALSPAEPVAPHDAAEDTRMRKCPGSGRHAKRASRAVAKSAPDPQLVTGSVTPGRSTSAVVREVPPKRAEGGEN